MPIQPTCRICSAPGTYFCTWCESSFFCDRHICAHIGKDKAEDEQKSKPVPAFGPELKAVLILIAVLIAVGLLWMVGGDGSTQ